MTWGVTIRVFSGPDQTLAEVQKLVRRNEATLKTLLARCVVPAPTVVCQVEFATEPGITVVLEAFGWVPNPEIQRKMQVAAESVFTPFILGLLEVAERTQPKNV